MRDSTGGVQSALVLGGSSDIGVAIARRLVVDRCRRVVLAGRPSAALDASAEGLRTAGAEVEVVGFDAADTASHAEVLDRAFAGGDLDVVVMAFGVLGDQDTFDRDTAAAVDAVTVNYTGAVSSGLLVAEHLRRQGHGTLVVISSVAGVRTRRDNFVYGSTKAGLDGFAQGLGDALQGTGARVMVVRPGFVSTKMTDGMAPAPFSTTADAVADDVVEGLQRGRHTVWSPKVLAPVFGLLRVVPRPVWRKLAR
jgi:decaprenylphospho-beta-D-erythro-pentofuranosid-2-ulose 2-reductase